MSLHIQQTACSHAPSWDYKLVKPLSQAIWQNWKFWRRTYSVPSYSLLNTLEGPRTRPLIANCLWSLGTTQSSCNSRQLEQCYVCKTERYAAIKMNLICIPRMITYTVCMVFCITIYDMPQVEHAQQVTGFTLGRLQGPADARTLPDGSPRLSVPYLHAVFS